MCEAHLPCYTTQSLPYGQHNQLSTDDIDKIKTVLRKYLSTDSLQEMVKLYNTNQCESIRSQLFRWPQSIEHGVETSQDCANLLFTQPA